MYEFLEKNKNNILKNLQALFNNSRLNLLNIDEINALNVTTEVSNLFKKIEKNANLMFEGEIRSLAKSTGKDVGFFELDEYLDDYNPTLQYVYKNELERKKARYVEAIMSIGVISSLAMEELMSKNIRNMNTQIQETLAYMELQGHLDAWEDDGVEYVIWHTSEDDHVCDDCKLLNNHIFSIKDCPDLLHIGCRCEIEPITEEEKEILEKENKEYFDNYDNNNKKEIDNNNQSDIIRSRPPTSRQSRVKVTQERIDEIIEKYLQGVNFTVHPVANNRLTDYGKSSFKVIPPFDRIEIVKIEIGKQKNDSDKELIDTLLHEELETRIGLRSNHSDKYKELLYSSNSVRHRYLQKIIDRYMKWLEI